MLGHLKPQLCQLSMESKQNYWLFYCAGCASLRKQNGLGYSMLLNNELTLLLYAFEGEYQNLTQITTACPATALILRRDAFAHPAIDRASQLSIVLAWLKALDWHTDNPSLAKKMILTHLTRKTRKIIPNLQEQSQEIIAQYAHITRTNETDFNLVRQYTNRLSQILVAEIAQSIGVQECIKKRIGDLFGQIGELIAIADHLIDLEKDMYGKQYNPIIDYVHHHNHSWQEAYHLMKMDYKKLVFQINQEIIKEQSFFAETLKASLQQLDYKIEKAMPTFLRNTHEQKTVSQLQLFQAGIPHIPPEFTHTIANDPCCDSCLSAFGAACATACCECSCNACSDNCCKSKDNRRSRRRQNNQNQNENENKQ